MLWACPAVPRDAALARRIRVREQRGRRGADPVAARRSAPTSGCRRAEVGAVVSAATLTMLAVGDADRARWRVALATRTLLAGRSGHAPPALARGRGARARPAGAARRARAVRAQLRRAVGGRPGTSRSKRQGRGRHRCARGCCRRGLARGPRPGGAGGGHRRAGACRCWLSPCSRCLSASVLARDRRRCAVAAPGAARRRTRARAQRPGGGRGGRRQRRAGSRHRRDVGAGAAPPGRKRALGRRNRSRSSVSRRCSGRLLRRAPREWPRVQSTTRLVAVAVAALAATWLLPAASLSWPS